MYRRECLVDDVRALRLFAWPICVDVCVCVSVCCVCAGYDKQALRAARLTRVSTEPDTTLTQSFTAPQPIQRVSTQPDNNPSQPDNTPTQRLAPAPGPLVCVDPSRPANLKYVKQLNPTTGQVTHVDW